MLGLGHGGLYKQVYSDDTLTEAWRKVRTGTEMAGVDGVTVNLFQARLFANLKALQTELRKGRYAPQPVKRLSIPKADGSQRPLGILTVRDRIVQRAVLIVVEPLFEAGFEACSHGYRKGRSVQTALTQLCQFINQGYGWIVDFDIAACFETINTNRLCTFVNERLKNPELRRLVRAWLDMEAAAVTRAGMRRKRQTVGILQGGTLSPLFANIYLDRFDKALLKRGAKLVRYADDGVVCCQSKAEAEAALKVVHKLLGKLDLAVNPYKTAIQHVDKGFDYLGERFFLRHPRNGAARVETRPLKAPRPQAALPPAAQPETVHAMTPAPGGNDTWELST